MDPTVLGLYSYISFIMCNVYLTSYSTSGGVSRTESGSLTSTGYQVKGSYEYLGSDGIKYTVEFVADENGYRPRLGILTKKSQH